MSKSTFITPGHSQVVLRICPRHTILGWIAMGFSTPFVFAIVPAWTEFQKGNLVTGTFALMLSLGMSILLIYTFLTDDLLTLSQEGITYRRKSFSTRECFFPLSAIIRFELVWESSGRSGHYKIVVHLKHLKQIDVANGCYVSKEVQQDFIDKCTEFLKSQRDIIQEQSLINGKNKEGAMKVIYLKTNQPFFADQPVDSSWIRDETASEFTISRKGKFLLNHFLVTFFYYMVCNGIVTIFILFLCGVFPGAHLTERGILPMILFSAAGLYTLYNMLKSLFAPWGYTKFIFTKTEIVCEYMSLGIKSKEQIDVSQIEKLEIEPDGLWFISDDGTEKEGDWGISVESLAEAQWLASKFQQIHGDTMNEKPD